MRLLIVELTRLRWRRAVVILLAGCVLVPALIFAGLAWNTRPVSDADLRSAQAQVAAETQRPNVQKELQRCLKNPGRYGADPADPQATCEQLTLPQVEWFLYRDQLVVDEERESSGFAVLTILVGLLMLIGTTFVGHDWASGSMSNQLLFEPRRLRVWAAKAAVVFLTGLIVSAVVLAAYWGGIALLASTRDIATSAPEWELIRNASIRGSLLAAFAALGGYALTMLFRSTVATLGVMFAVSVGGSLLITGVLGTAAERWLLPTNFYAVYANGYGYFAGDCYEQSDGAGGCMERLSLIDGATYLGVMLLVAVVLSIWSFRRRDIG